LGYLLRVGGPIRGRLTIIDDNRKSAFQGSCQTGRANSASNINQFRGRPDSAFLWALHKKAPACAFEWRPLLPVAARRASLRDRRGCRNLLQLLAKAACSIQWHGYCSLAGAEIVSMTSATLAFAHIPSVSAETAAPARRDRLHDREATRNEVR
jgi:hypothetical protein